MFVHSSRIQKQIDYLASQKINYSPLLKQLDISEDNLKDPAGTFEFEQYKAVIEFVLRQTNDPFYGLKMGNQPQLAGTIGMMCASCTNLRDAFINGSKFLQIQGNIAEMQIVDNNSLTKLKYNVFESWLVNSPQTAKVEIDTMFSFLNTIVNINSNNTIKPVKIFMAIPKPENYQKYSDYFSIIPEFSSNENSLVYNSSSLLIPMKAFNLETLELLKSHLQSKLDIIRNNETITDKVKRIIHTTYIYQFPDIETVATKLNISARTLQRKLYDEKTSFKILLQDIKFDIAKKLLKNNSLSVSEVSYTLGYADLGNFSRSFKKVFGVSPQQYRETKQL